MDPQPRHEVLQDSLRVGSGGERELRRAGLDGRALDPRRLRKRGTVSFKSEVGGVLTAAAPGLLEGSRENHASFVDQDNLVHQLLRLSHLMCREEDCPPGASE